MSADATKIIVGVDLSLTSTGVAIFDGEHYITTLIKPKDRRGHHRLAYICLELMDIAAPADLVVFEGPAYSMATAQSGHHERGGLWWMATHRLWNMGMNLAVASPTALKKYATGRGNANKDLVLTETVRRFVKFKGGNDEADALVLCAIGADHLGVPIVSMPAAHRAALLGVEWEPFGRP